MLQKSMLRLFSTRDDVAIFLVHASTIVPSTRMSGFGWRRGGWALRIWFTDVIDDGFVTKYDDGIFEDIDSDEIWKFILHMRQGFLHYEVCPFYSVLEFEF